MGIANKVCRYKEKACKKEHTFAFTIVEHWMMVATPTTDHGSQHRPLKNWVPIGTTQENNVYSDNLSGQISSDMETRPTLCYISSKCIYDFSDMMSDQT